MIQYAGEGRGYDAWRNDKRAWALEDSSGRDVKDYAMSCCVEDVRKEALESGYQKVYRQMLEMALDEASSVQSFESHAERNNCNTRCPVTMMRCDSSIHAFPWVVWIYSSGTSRHFTMMMIIILCTKVSAEIFQVVEAGKRTNGFQVFSVHRQRSFLLETVWRSLGNAAESKGLIWMVVGCYMGGTCSLTGLTPSKSRTEFVVLNFQV
jgi:hypothetical protein